MAATLYTIKISEAITCAMQLDCSGMRKELGISDGFKMLRHGCKITATLDEIERIAHHMEREDGYDMTPQAISACNRKAKELRTFVAEQRAGKDLKGQ